MVPIQNCGPKRLKGISKAVEYAPAQLTTSELLAESMTRQRYQREGKAVGKTTETAREEYEYLSMTINCK